MKNAIILSVRPEGVVEILNGKKTIEIRKTMPKCGLPIDVYIYCTKGKELRLKQFEASVYPCAERNHYWTKFQMAYLDTEESCDALCDAENDFLRECCAANVCVLSEGTDVRNETDEAINGKVVAKFTLRKVEQIDVPYPAYFHEVKDMYKHITEGSLMSLGDLHAYLGTDSGYAWHISDLKIFDNPKTVWQMEFFSKPKKVREIGHYNMLESKQISKAPQSWRYVEIER